ncbi:hypothetical protein CN072_22335 [Sinorhizobium meliloti]|uniref:hypothetical protein n=1 Tax=Rhizobium meliloti TaxID=382 RepID=UPI000FD19079|nr:hypothetical protein [Sinorhizobium meliloti]RVG92099.1 hypothetical protein CN218_18635 [Sinorhizobium meliloti]RVP82055.1 hypothetical protein CN072_22335 [Sinorhizobium meliloti]
MSIARCLSRLVDAKRITQKQADDALALHEGLQGRLYPNMGPTSAEAASALEAARVMAQAAQERKLMAAKQAIAYASALDRMEKHPAGKTVGLQSMLVRDNLEGGEAMGSAIHIDGHSENVTKRLLGMMDGAMKPYASRLAGLRQDTESIWNIVNELFGKDTGDDAAKAAAAGWQKATQYAVDRVKRAGKPLSVLEDWRLPQSWDSGRVRRFSEQEFINDLMTEFEAGNLRVMDKQGQGEAPRAAVGGIIANAYKDITLGKANSGTGGFSNQLRVFRFQNPDAYIRLMQKYGIGDGGLYNTMMGHLGGMGREIATVEILGPNYGDNFRRLLDVAREDDAVRNKSIGAKLKRSLSMNSPAAVQRTYDAVTGKLGVAQSDLIAGIGGGMRNIQTAARLGSATIAALPGDSFTASLAANHNGIPATAVLGRLVRDLTTNREGAEEIARQVNLTAASVMDHALGTRRFADEVVGQGLTGRVADTTMRLTGINAWTEGLKRAWAMEFNGFIARQADHAFNDLDPAFQGFLKRYGFTPEQWDKLRATPQIEADGARFFDVNGVEDQELGDRLMAAILDERRFAVIEPDARIRGAMTAGLHRGTFMGEMARSATQFKSFPMTFMMTHMMRAAIQDGAWNKISAGAKLVTLATIAGAVTSQMQSLVAGRDPQDMSTPEFWTQAFIRGGGGGMLGDLVYSSSTRGGDGLKEYILGPAPGTILSATGDLSKALIGDGKMTGKMLAQHIKAWTPGSSLWFSKIATDRLLFDQIQTMLDPNYRQSFSRYEQRMKKDFGQAFWWRPGEVAPDRGPDF